MTKGIASFRRRTLLATQLIMAAVLVSGIALGDRTGATLVLVCYACYQCLFVVAWRRQVSLGERI